MRKVIRLVSIQLWAVLASMFAMGENKKRKTRALYVGFVLFLVLISGVSFIYAYSMGIVLRMFDSIEIMPSLFMAMTSVLVLFTTLFKVKGTLFAFKDYDMVMSLPVSNSQVVASRLILLYSINFVFVLVVMVPVMIAYGILAGPGLNFYIYGIILVLFIPLIPIIIASVLGTGLAYISSGFRFKNLAYILFSFILLIGFMIVPVFLGDSTEAMVELGQEINKKVQEIYPLAGIYSKAIIGGEFVSAIIFMAISLLSFWLFSLLVGRVFVRINSSLMSGVAKGNYKLGELKTSSPLKALYLIDLKRYFVTPIYVMNTAFGVVIAFLAGLSLPFINLDNLSGQVDLRLLRDFLPMFIGFCMATSSTTMAGISIEGKNLWIKKSLPVSIDLIFAAKILVNLTVLAPILIASVVLGITMGLPFINVLVLLLMVVVFSLYISLYGLVINLIFPNLTWTNETVIIKQSTASLISVFSGMGMVGVLALLWGLTKDSLVAIILFIILLCVLILVLYKWLSYKGKKRFLSL